MSVLDVLQIFGRAGRPGLESSGEGYIFTTEDKLTHYLDSILSQVRALTYPELHNADAHLDAHRVPVSIVLYTKGSPCHSTVESRFQKGLVDALNAEISLGTVSNVDDAVRWLGYTYLIVRMKKNPVYYGKFGLVSD